MMFVMLGRGFRKKKKIKKRKEGDSYLKSNYISLKKSAGLPECSYISPNRALQGFSNPGLLTGFLFLFFSLSLFLFLFFLFLFLSFFLPLFLSSPPFPSHISI